MLKHVFAWVFLGMAMAAFIGFAEKRAQRVLLWVGVRTMIPLMIFTVVMQNFPVDKVSDIYKFILVAVGFLVIANVFSRILHHFGKLKVDKGSWMLTCSFHNYGFSAYAIVESLFGKQTLSQLFIFVITVECLLWTWGLSLIHKGGGTFKKLLSPPAIALALSLFLRVFYPIDLEATEIGKAVCWIASWAIPICLTLIGVITYHSFSKDTFGYFKQRTVWLGLGMRHLLMPVLLLTLTFLFLEAGALRDVTMVQAIMPMAFMPMAMIAIYGKDFSILGAMMIISNFLSFITLPVFLIICQSIFNL